MRLHRPTDGHSGVQARAGFTLAEAAVTIAVVAIVLTLTLQALEGAKVTAAGTMYRKTARELGMEMLGEIEAGRWQDDLDSGASGSFAEKDAPDYLWELALGDDTFPDVPEQDLDDPNRPFDNWRARDEWREQNEDDPEGTEGEEEAQPFEKVKIRVRYPKIREFEGEITLERWVRWEQVYGKEEEEEVPTEADPNAAGGGTEGGAGTGGGTGDK